MQGSTFEKVILNMRTINYNRNLVEKERLLYTGITRTSELLILHKV